MTIFYKYCGPHGALKILNDFELKLPFISDVNDPDDCHPQFQYDRNLKKEFIGKILKSQDQYLGRHRDYQDVIDTDKIYEIIKNGAYEVQKSWKSKSCVISVTHTPYSTKMWDKYANSHSGIVIEFDFDNLIEYTCPGITMDRVYYLDNPFQIMVDNNLSTNDFIRALLVKTKKWEYEEEFRTVIDNGSLEKLKNGGAAYLKDFDGKQTWFLKIRPHAIKSVIVGNRASATVIEEVKELIQTLPRKHIKLQKIISYSDSKVNVEDIELS